MALTPRDKRMLQILGAVAGLAIVFFLMTRVLGGGDDGELAIPTGPTAVVPPTGPVVSPTPEPTDTLPPVVLAGARDPFSTPPELITTSAVPTGGTTPPPGGGTATTTSQTTTIQTSTSSTSTFTFPTSTSTGTGTSTSTGTTTSTTSPGPDGGGDGEPTDRITVGEHDLRLVSVDGRRNRVEIRVDRRLWTVEEGGVFEQVFKLVRIDGKCAKFLFGDDSFTLCVK